MRAAAFEAMWRAIPLYVLSATLRACLVFSQCLSAFSADGILRPPSSGLHKTRNCHERHGANCVGLRLRLSHIMIHTGMLFR